jgi:hypothetical protein
MAFWTRRKFIFVGIAGAIAAGVATVVVRKNSAPAPKGTSLIKEHDHMLRAIAASLLGSGLSTDASIRAVELARVLAAIAALADNLPPSTRKEIGDLFGLLALKPARAVLGYSGDWVDADAPLISQFLYGLRDSAIALKQQSYFALHDLVLGSFYSEPKAWVGTGYPGPPKLG